MNGGVVYNKISEDLGFNYFYVQSPYNSLIEGHTEIFYMIEGGIFRPFNERGATQGLSPSMNFLNGWN
jgi:hypothetical protein